MVAALLKMITLFALSSLLILNGAIGDLICEELPVELCAYSISDTGKRCVLENYLARKGMRHASTTAALTETVSAIASSSDYLLSPNFVAKLCSQPCFSYCPNILDLYSNLAQAEGMNLHDICIRGNAVSRSALYILPKSSGGVDGGAAGTAGEGNGAIGAPVGSPLSSPAFPFADDGSTTAFASSPDNF
ncbi:unnamed protein product [Linum trigynum]|uniref:Uncharacterized protein n=1 Tax=Linum trigynum TaxID=586398 RepID=A0AAV2FV09_9ROSI